MKSDLNKEAEVTELVIGQEMHKSTVPSALKTFAFYNVAVSEQTLEVHEPSPGAVVNLQEQFAALESPVLLLGKIHVYGRFASTTSRQE